MAVPLLGLRQRFQHGVKILVCEETEIFRKGKLNHAHTLVIKFDFSASLPWGWTIANMLVFKKVRDALGFSKCRITLVGSAPIHRETLEFFMALDIPVLDLYGMSECTGPQTISLKSSTKWRTGSCGTTMSGVETKIDNPDENGDGEVSSVVK